MSPTFFEIELQDGRHIETTAMILPDAHTSAYVREALLRVLHERFGLNDESTIKTFRYVS
ncbi:MAG: hypothetical protein GC166_06335 [Alphaproteobacteria bacterium]|nr:hypothetical protein [Alphaproteobacteria bacterium]